MMSKEWCDNGVIGDVVGIAFQVIGDSGWFWIVENNGECEWG
jgi:hypothetical protein